MAEEKKTTAASEKKPSAKTTASAEKKTTATKTTTAKKPAAAKTTSTAAKKPAPKAETKAVAKATAEEKPAEVKAEAKVEAKKPVAKKKSGIKVRLIRSLVGRSDKQIATAKSLGLRKINDFSIQPDNAATRGKLTQISHMVEVTEA